MPDRPESPPASAGPLTLGDLLNATFADVHAWEQASLRRQIDPDRSLLDLLRDWTRRRRERRGREERP